jgi:glucosylceramidase
MKKTYWVYSNENEQWAKKDANLSACAVPNLHLDGREYQSMYGFGACFNELGYIALNHLDQAEQKNGDARSVWNRNK